MTEDRNFGELSKLGGMKNSNYATCSDQRTGKVLVSNKSQLVAVIINTKDTSNLVVTVDSKNLLRGWSMVDCSTAFSYKIPFE
jgi:hypothetical protein